MDIASLLNSFRSILPTDASATPEKPAPTPTNASASRPTVPLSPQSQSALRDVLSRYDVTHISARDFSQLLQELKQSGAITSDDMEELSLVRLELDRQGFDPDELLNLPELLQRKLQTQERELSRAEEKQGRPIDRSSVLQTTLRQIDWISKFALIHQSGGYQSLNAVA